jgi:site-specific DNA recombinase
MNSTPVNDSSGNDRKQSPAGTKASNLRGSRKADFEKVIAENQQEIVAIYGEYLVRNPRRPGSPVGALYARFSTEYQSSVADQIRALLADAEKRGIFIPFEHIFADYGISGRRRSRPALDLLRKALQERRAKVLLVLSLSRLFRNHRGCIEFIEDEIIGNGARCIVLDKGIDTDDRDRWQLFLSIHAMFDDFNATAQRANIRAGHVGLASHGELWGSIPVGYSATDDNGDRCEVRIDPQGAEYIRRIFRWFAEDGLSIDSIVRRLNADPNCPAPPMSDGRWTRQIVRRALQNPRYRGEWAYGRTERRWANKKDYAEAIKRAEPLYVDQVESLRLVDDELFFAADSRLANNVGNRGRRTSAGVRHPITFLLQGLLWCANHQRKMYRCGPNQDVYYVCTHCQCTTRSERPLFTLLDGELVVRCLIEELGRQLLSDGDLVGQVIAACQEAEARQQRPDKDRLAQLESQVSRLRVKIDSLLRIIGDTPEETRESEAVIRELRAERSSVQAELAALREASSRPIRVPTPEEVSDRIREIVAQLDLVLQMEAPDEDALYLAREILRQFTGGRIELTQQGERQQHHGWLRGAFDVDLIQMLASNISGLADAVNGSRVHIDFRRPNEDEELARKIVELRRGRMPIKQIAIKLGIGRNRASKLLREFAAQLAPELSVREGKKYVERIYGSPPPYQRIADEVRRHYENGLRIGEIAELMKLDRTTIKKALDYAYVSRGEQPPDTRKR